MVRAEVLIEKGEAKWPDAEATAYRPSAEIVTTHLLSNEHMGIILAAQRAPAALPEELLVGTIRDGRLHVHSPIHVKVIGRARKSLPKQPNSMSLVLGRTCQSH